MSGFLLDTFAETAWQRLKQMEQELQSQVVGQDDAVARVSKRIRAAAAGLKDPERPFGAFIFFGTGY